MRKSFTPCWALALLACNTLTGADDVLITDDDDGVAASPSGNSAAGGGGPGATSGAGGASVMPTQCAWPSGRYGVSVTQTVPESLSWQGYAAGSDAPGTVPVKGFFDCDATKGINAAMFSTSQFG